MRTFIAIELPQNIKDLLSRLQTKLKTSSAHIKWVKPENIHLTLKFLGEIDEKKIPGISSALSEIARKTGCFSIKLSSLGAFPGINSARVIWIGIEKGEENVKEIYKAMEENLKKEGFPEEKREFSSHITLGRSKSARNRSSLIKILNSLKDAPLKENAEFPVEKITFLKSTLTPGGPVYEVIKDFPLNV